MNFGKISAPGENDDPEACTAIGSPTEPRGLVHLVVPLVPQQMIPVRRKHPCGMSQANGAANLRCSRCGIARR